MSKAGRDRVLFRRDRTGNKGVFAIFPDYAGTMDATTCTVFEHVGQHSSGDVHGMMRQSTPAWRSYDTVYSVAADVRALARELRGRGYRLRVIHRIPRNSERLRRQAWER